MSMYIDNLGITRPNEAGRLEGMCDNAQMAMGCHCYLLAHRSGQWSVGASAG